MAEEDDPTKGSTHRGFNAALGPGNQIGLNPPNNLTAELVGKFVDQHLEKRAEKLQRSDVFAKSITDRWHELSRSLKESEDRCAEIQQTVSDVGQAHEGFKAAIVEDLKLRQARKLWSDSADRARNAYAVSWVILIVLLVGVPVLAIMNSPAIFQFFHTLSEAVLVDLPANATETAVLIAAVSRLILVTLPVALFIWLIRIVVRFNMRSLLLMDDARQRNTMLETYLHLVEQDKEVKADRPLVLEALFRRTPGHGPETIEPPNLADVLKLGSLSSGKSSS